jgi:hypothetical protein
MSGASAASAILALVLRAMLVRENNRRDVKGDDESCLEVRIKTDEGEKVVDPAFLDFTDRQNPAFRYVL